MGDGTDEKARRLDKINRSLTITAIALVIAIIILAILDFAWL